MTEYAYDPDRFDAEIILDRRGMRGPFTTTDLMELFGVSRTTIATSVRRGVLPRAEKPGKPGDQYPAEWSHDQIVGALATGQHPKQRIQHPCKNPRKRKEIEHGTIRGYRMEQYRGIKPCDLCRTARTVHDRRRGYRGWGRS